MVSLCRIRNFLSNLSKRSRSFHNFGLITFDICKLTIIANAFDLILKCTIVFQGSKNLQRHIVSPAKKNVTCLSFSNDGRYLAVGECGHEPVIRVWDVEEHALLAELMGHKFAICCVAFSPNMKYLVSIGSQHDMVANVWDWRNNVKVSSNKVSCKVTALSFSENGDYFVTVGFQDTVPLQGRSAILADQRNNLFCDVCCGRGPTSSSTYCITQSGLLCEFNNRRLLDKWVELKTRFAGSLCLGDDVIYVGCADGVIRVFKAADFQYITNLPRPHYLGVDVAGGLSAKHMLSAPDFVRYPDVIAMCYDASQKKVAHWLKYFFLTHFTFLLPSGHSNT
ncbi:unnamed protein product [Soboliphyme baturini]|uniref:WD_REPEATS_REGION domain-containing protein n=1 Tax=Soboliphyme baturini TaxID=241478 RepID=A0A183J6C4_9BILA|nr:unnamed protein product [Soboliphyme baturini]